PPAFPPILAQGARGPEGQPGGARTGRLGPQAPASWSVVRKRKKTRPKTVARSTSGVTRPVMITRLYAAWSTTAATKRPTPAREPGPRKRLQAVPSPARPLKAA